MNHTTDPHAGTPVLTAGTPLSEARAAVIALHGRGATPDDILQLQAAFRNDDVAWLAPAASGRSWYPYRFIAETAMNQPFLDSALARIRTLVDEIVVAGIPHESIVLLGFSQGACLSSEFVARNPRRWGGVVALSGGLIGPPGTKWETPGSLDRTPILIGCSDIDEHIPLARVEESARVLEQMGGDVTLRIYPGLGHTVVPDEIEIGRRIVEGAKRPRSTPR
jgi:predicted esterase